MLRHPCIVGGPQQSEKKCEVAIAPLSSEGVKRGGKHTVTPAFSGIPNTKGGEQIQNWLPHPYFLGKAVRYWFVHLAGHDVAGENLYGHALFQNVKQVLIGARDQITQHKRLLLHLTTLVPVHIRGSRLHRASGGCRRKASTAGGHSR